MVLNVSQVNYSPERLSPLPTDQDTQAQRYHINVPRDRDTQIDMTVQTSFQKLLSTFEKKNPKLKGLLGFNL